MWLPEIKHSSSPALEQHVLELHIPEALAHFSGHFPDLPLLPGVTQVDWAIRWARDHFKIAGEFLSLDNLKFQAMIFPGEDVRLELNWQADKAQLSFTYRKSDQKEHGQVFSSGRVTFSGAAA